MYSVFTARPEAKIIVKLSYIFLFYVFFEFFVSSTGGNNSWNLISRNFTPPLLYILKFFFRWLCWFTIGSFSSEISKYKWIFTRFLLWQRKIKQNFRFDPKYYYNCQRAFYYQCSKWRSCFLKRNEEILNHICLK